MAILEENMIIGSLVYRDFSNVLAAYGDVVNTRKPGEFRSIRKTDQDEVTIQAATATNIPVPLDQHLHVSFLLRDGEETKAFQELVQIYLRPAALAIARQIDIILSCQVHRFRKYAAGGLNTLTAANASNILIDTRTRMNINKVLEDNDRNLVLTTISEGILLKNNQFTDANRVGDDGTALREASLGRKYGFNIFMAQNTPYVPPAGGATKTTGTINFAGGYPAGTSTFTVAGFSAAITPGTWIQIVGDDTPLQVVSTVGGATPTSITVFNPTSAPVANSAAVTTYTPGTVNNAAGYPAGYAKEIIVASCAPQVGQGVTFGTDNANVYGIIDVVGSTIVLDRPLAAGLANGAAVNLTPPGSYNFAFHRTAIAFVNRPLAIPRDGMGALAAVIEYNNLAIRATLTYDGINQGTLVTLDMLAGVAQLEPLNGVVMYG